MLFDLFLRYFLCVFYSTSDKLAARKIVVVLIAVAVRIFDVST